MTIQISKATHAALLGSEGTTDPKLLVNSKNTDLKSLVLHNPKNSKVSKAAIKELEARSTQTGAKGKEAKNILTELQTKNLYTPPKTPVKAHS